MLSINKWYGFLFVFVILIVYLSNGYAVSKELFERYGVKFNDDFSVEMPKGVKLTISQGINAYVMIQFSDVGQVFAAYAETKQENSYYLLYEERKWYLAISEQVSPPDCNQEESRFHIENARLAEELKQKEAEFQAKEEKLKMEIDRKDIEYFKICKSLGDEQAIARELNGKIKELEGIIQDKSLEIANCKSSKQLYHKEQCQKLEEKNRKIEELEKQLKDVGEVVSGWVGRNNILAEVECDSHSSNCSGRLQAKGAKKKKRKRVEPALTVEDSLISQIKMLVTYYETLNDQYQRMREEQQAKLVLLKKAERTNDFAEPGKREMKEQIKGQQEKINHLQQQMEQMKLNVPQKEDRLDFPIEGKCHANRLCLLGAVMEGLGITVDSAGFALYKDQLLPNLFARCESSDEEVAGISKDFLAILSSISNYNIIFREVPGEKEIMSASPGAGINIPVKKKKVDVSKEETLIIDVWRPAFVKDPLLHFHFLQNKKLSPYHR